MEPLVAVLAAILALNLAYGLFIGLLEVRRHRRARREIGTLEAMWRLDPRAPHRTERRAVRSFRVAGVLAASLMVLGGIAIATPGGRGTVSTVTEAIGSLIAAPDGQAAEAPELTNMPAPGQTTSLPGTASREMDAGGAVDDGVASGPRSGTADDDPVLSPVAGSDAPTGEPDPAAEEPPPSDDDPSAEPSPSPTLDPPPGLTVRTPSVSATSVTLEWEAVPSATGYRLERSGGSSDGLTVDLTGTAWTDEGLAPETAYTYVVTATLEDGSSVQAQATVVTPAAP